MLVIRGEQRLAAYSGDSLLEHSEIFVNYRQVGGVDALVNGHWFPEPTTEPAMRFQILR